MDEFQFIDQTESLETLVNEFDSAACLARNGNNTLSSAEERANKLICLLHSYISGPMENEFWLINQKIECEFTVYKGNKGLIQVGAKLSRNSESSEFVVTETIELDKSLRYHTSYDTDVFIVSGENVTPSDFIMDKARECCLKLLTPLQRTQLSLATLQDDTYMAYPDKRYILN